MLEIAILTCIEASKAISNINDTNLPNHIKVELVQVVLDHSDCKNGNV